MAFNRSIYFDYIERKLTELACSIESRGLLNVLNYHNHSEDFYVHFLNRLYGLELTNVNPSTANVEAIDLIDRKNKLVVQVSATNTALKVESSLKKDLIKSHKDHTFKFVCISKDANALRKKAFANPHGISFSPLADILDKNSILGLIKGLGIDELEDIYKLVEKELGSPISPRKLDSCMASIINTLGKIDWPNEEKKPVFNAFEIEKKIVQNDLKATKQIIDDYKIFQHKVDEKYQEFDKAGANKSYAVLQLISRYYTEESTKFNDADSIFLAVTRRVRDEVLKSGNFENVESEILSICVDIVVVDAFIRCKIFKNPTADMSEVEVEDNVAA